MQFSRLRLNGFKSFVDPTELVISDGLTGVVGPNGCGKSNLLEALRWVMGENRPKAMRGGGMEDVIFAGTTRRPARHFAEVSLTIDNSDRRAPAMFNHEDQLDIVRRITRDVGSAYKVAGKDVRARDVQMLFADASTGAHSPALVRQGQIAELINAKPQARRRILEDAAGISGLYQRRHEAELKLNAAEQNLTRVDDVLDQLAQQLSSLARQARQATRYREIGAELREFEAIWLYLRWKEAQAQTLAAQTHLREAVLLASKAEAEVREAQNQREAAEAALPPLREEEQVAGVIYQRLEIEREQLGQKQRSAKGAIAALEKRLAQLERDLERESTLRTDADESLKRLHDEDRELARLSEGFDSRLAEAERDATEAAEILGERENQHSEFTETLARLSARTLSVTRLRDDSLKQKTRAEAELATANATLADLGSAIASAQTQLEAARAAEAKALHLAEQAESHLAQSEAQKAETLTALNAAQGAVSTADGERKALAAEVDALRKLLARDRGDAAAVIDELRVAPGYEQAIGAALADELRSPVIDEGGDMGWAPLGADPVSNAPLPEGADALAAHVEAPAPLTRRLSQIGVVAAAQGNALAKSLKPGQRLVSVEGDLWRWDGYRVGAAHGGSSAALKLQQRNRLAALENDLETADSALSQRRSTLAEAQRMHEISVARETEAREMRRSADKAVSEAHRALGKAESEAGMLSAKKDTAELALTRFRAEATAAASSLSDAETQLAELPDLEAERAKLSEMKTAVEAARITVMSRRSAFDEMRRDGEARAKRQQQIAQEIAKWEHRITNASAQQSDLQERHDQTERELAKARRKPAQLNEDAERLAASARAAHERKTRADDARAAAEGALRAAQATEREAERRASDAREAKARDEERATAAQAALTAAAERIEEEQACTPTALRESIAREEEALPGLSVCEEQIAGLRRKRDALGAVNLRAEEDAQEVREEHETLTKEKADLEAAITQLRGGIASLNTEGRQRLLEAFDKVNETFGLLFTHLFNGGDARLTLVESDDPLNAGLEILCQPPGKKLSTLSLLSGGEQTLTAMALIFAVFLVNPAPICVLDEVDAPLDDANVTRFCDLLDEMTRRTNTRFLIITHHAVTMSRMDRLFGVTMGEQGVSQLVSVDLSKAETLVA